MIDLTVFATPEAWISLVTLTFLEIVLGVDNIVFIVITTDRLPASEQHIGRKLGLLGAMVSRIIFLCFASFLVHMTTPLFTVDTPFYSHGFAVRDLVLALGGAYLLYKGIDELVSMMRLDDLREAEEHIKHPEEKKRRKGLNLPEAVGTIMVMDVVFSIDSVITAVGMAEHLIVMILAVMIAIVIMMAFIDPISDFINKHSEMKMLALTFIVVIGALLVSEGLGFEAPVEVLGMALEKFVVYVAMAFSFVLALLQIGYRQRLEKWHEEHEGVQVVPTGTQASASASDVKVASAGGQADAGSKAAEEKTLKRS